MATSAGSRLAPSTFLTDSQQHRRLIALWMREAHQGHLGNTGDVTLATSAVSTVVTDFRVGPNSCIGFMPQTANAAAEIATLYVSSRSAEAFTITHANNGNADRTFTYSVLG